MTTKDEFLARCANAYDAGLITPEAVRLLNFWTDMVLRLEGGQISHFADALEYERRRTNGFNQKLANDTVGYQVIQFAAILKHPCQLCATDPNAWWTRSAFCDHKVVTA